MICIATPCPKRISGCGLDRTPLHIDWQRGAALDEWLQVFAVWTPDTWPGRAAWKRAQRILRYAHWQAEQHPDRMRIVQRREQLGASVLHQCGALLALESAAALAGSCRISTRPLHWG